MSEAYFDASSALLAREIIARFRARARQANEAVNGYWSRLADQIEDRLLKRTGWTA
jgi:hypothetical protein